MALVLKPIGAEDPNEKKLVATYEYSPYHLMSWSSFLGAFFVNGKFTTKDKGSPDYNRSQVNQAKGLAIEVILWSGMFDLYLSAILMKPNINQDELDKLGEFTVADIDREILARHRKAFLFFHSINLIATSAVASQSVRKDRWSMIATQAVFPFIIDLASRFIFNSNTASPWSILFVPKFENQAYNSELILSYRW